jgi:hypothetical protein
LQAVGNQCEFVGDHCEQERRGILNESEQRTAIFASRPDYVCKLLQLTPEARATLRWRAAWHRLGVSPSRRQQTG